MDGKDIEVAVIGQSKDKRISLLTGYNGLTELWFTDPRTKRRFQIDPLIVATDKQSYGVGKPFKLADLYIICAGDYIGRLCRRVGETPMGDFVLQIVHLEPIAHGYKSRKRLRRKQIIVDHPLIEVAAMNLAIVTEFPDERRAGNSDPQIVEMRGKLEALLLQGK